MRQINYLLAVLVVFAFGDFGLWFAEGGWDPT